MKIIKKFIALPFAILLVACQAVPNPNLQIDKKHAHKRMFECAIDKVSKLDDGISPATEIGVVVGQLCSDETREYARIVAAEEGRSEKFANMLHQKLIDEGFSINVMQYRNDKSGILKKK